MFDKISRFLTTLISPMLMLLLQMYKGVKPMWEQLGFDNSQYDVPNLNDIEKHNT